MNTTKAAHTPGPWLVQRGEECCFHDGNRFAITQAGTDEQGEKWDQTIAEVWPADNGQDGADARLIAAAPDLLRALELAIKSMDASSLIFGCLPICRAAIRKARGAQ